MDYFRFHFCVISEMTETHNEIVDLNAYVSMFMDSGLQRRKEAKCLFLCYRNSGYFQLSL